MSTITLNQTFPWGRSLDEYRRMFALTEADLSGRILGCADGPASFNAEMARRGVSGGRVVSSDTLYQFSAGEIRRRIEATHVELTRFAQVNRQRFVWDTFGSPEELGRVRLAAMDKFLEDYEAGKRQGRYVIAALPHQPFANGAFDLALCSHFLFLYSRQFSLEFHLASLRELVRVAREVRVFPLLDHDTGQRSPHLDAVLALNEPGWKISVETVPYEFQRGGNQMLRIRRDAASQRA